MDTDTGIRKIGTFYDNKLYPRGFGKHGDFSIAQANALHDYGATLNALAEGRLQATTEAEAQFIKVCQGEVAASSFLEKTWQVYQGKINARRVNVSPFNSYSKKTEEKEIVEEETFDSELEDELVA